MRFFLTAIALLLTATTSSAQTTDPALEACTAVFRYLQSDAYSEVAGRNNERWPPHTTTVFEVRCGTGGDQDLVERLVMLNHGGPLDRTDERGRPFLEEVHRESKTGTREEMLALGQAIGACECATDFLGTAALEQGTEREWLAALTAYAEENLDCPRTNLRQAALAALRAPDVERAAATLAQCDWLGDGGAEGAFDQALAAAGGELETYHVCNNDARLQSLLWSRFTPGEPIPACAGGEEICRGPLWSYEPGC